MKIVKSVIWFVLLLLLGIKVGSIEVFAQGINMEKWMSQLSDEKHLSEFSLPGTHESAATKGIKIPIWGKDYGKCQNESLINQLSMGVRYFDIRCRYLSETTLAIHHGDIYQNLMFGDVLNTFNNFLNTHPTETIVMRFKQEKSSVSDEEFRKALAYYVAKYPSNLFWENKDHTRRTPILKELRGKIILLYDISIANNSWDEFGLTYGSFSSQDYYATSDRDKKWQNIKQCLERANKDITLGVINYSSAQGDWKCTPEDLSRTLNPKLCSELRDSKYIHSGIIASDFMNQELSSLIISLNWRQMVYSLFEDEAQTKINKNIYYGRINEVRNTITSLSESEEKNRLLGMVENAKKLYEEQQQVEIVVGNSEIQVGDTWQASDNFVSATAKDGTQTTDINDVKVSGTVDTTKAGVYPITYEYDGATKTINVTVKEKAPETDVEKVDLTSVYRLRNSKSYERLYTIDENEKNNLTVKHANLGWYEEKSPNSSLNLKVLKTKPENGKQFYRLKNVKSGEHLFTADENEVKVLTTKYGWTIERNINMYVYGESGKPKDAKRIYRLRNTKSGERVYTVDENEKKVLTTRYAHLGWIEEGQAISSRMYTK